jgi:lysophospholipase L1-like esterase
MSEAITLAIIGDSAASGVGDSDKFGNYFGWGFYLAQAFTEPIVYLNVARPGAQSKEVLKEQLPKVLIHEPELVAVIVGGNDLLRNNFSPKIFEEQLNEILSSLVKTGSTVMLLELHDPTEIVPMPFLVARVCRRRVDFVNKVTHKLAKQYGAIILPTRSLENIYERQMWHVDRMHPSRMGHQFIADNFAHLLRQRGFEVGAVQCSKSNNRSRRDSIIWMIKNGTPWFLKRSVDLLPALIFLSLTEILYIWKNRGGVSEAQLYFPNFANESAEGLATVHAQRVS